MKNKKIIVTGSCGFIGYNLCEYLISKGKKVIGIDNLDNYYSVNLKRKRLNLLKKKKFKFFRLNILDSKLNNIFKNEKPDLIINLAAQPGVRYSFENPQKYIDYNIKGFLNVLECMKKNKINKLIFASSSSVYGNSKKFPTKENMPLKPENLYGLTKVFNEDMAKFYHQKFGISSVGLRFFTVYGKIGRPDMFIPKVISNIKRKKVINLYNNGKHHRDFTHVDDISVVIDDIVKKMIRNKKSNCEIYNLCYGKTVKIGKIIEEVSKNLNTKPKIKNIKFQLGDMFKTHGSNSKISKKYKFKNLIDITKGIKEIISKN